ncbi:MAG: hypothetical protein JWP81_2373 [Ferruginibacter sp.]|nr:hypothetical protein [Ferruginibacter sp.]
MNSKLLLLAISVAAFSSCTTLYKSGQTPDDVYYSPARPYGEETKKEQQKDEVRNEVRNYNYRNTYSYEDRTIRLGINDRRWRYFDNDYAYNPYNYGFNYGYYYNPYFWPYPVYSPVFFAPTNPKNTTPRTISLGGYNTTGYTNNNLPVNSKMGTIRPTVRSYNNNNNGSAVGNVIRQIFTAPASSNNNNSNNSYNTPSSNNTRTYTPSSTPSSSSSSSSGSSSSGSGGVSRPPRSGGN